MQMSVSQVQTLINDCWGMENFSRPIGESVGYRLLKEAVYNSKSLQDDSVVNSIKRRISFIETIPAALCYNIWHVAAAAIFGIIGLITSEGKNFSRNEFLNLAKSEGVKFISNFVCAFLGLMGVFSPEISNNLFKYSYKKLVEVDPQFSTRTFSIRSSGAQAIDAVGAVAESGIAAFQSWLNC